MNALVLKTSKGLKAFPGLESLTFRHFIHGVPLHLL